MTSSGNHTQDIINSYIDGVMTERNRIIKLLEHNANHYGCAWDCPQPCDAPTFCELLAQIKGEQK